MTHFPILTESDEQRESMMEKPINVSSSECVKCLSWGPSKFVKSCHGYFVNGFWFHTQERGSGSLTYNYSERVKDIPLVDIPFKEDVDISGLQGWTLMFKTLEFSFTSWMVCGGKKKRAHLETSIPSAAASILPKTSSSPTIASIPLRTPTPLAGASISPGTSHSSKRYQCDPIHERAIWDAWQKQASLLYKNLMYKVQVLGYQHDCMTIVQYTSLCDEWGLEAYKERLRRHGRTVYRDVVVRGSTSTSVGLAVENGRGLCTVRPICPTASAEGTVGRYTIQQVLGKVL
ncbi:hypothetical protein M9H77_22924 [Catharanthus roseus]|uniref:Uncharacterized protein n=1 Tax=Catharanthus roseus TaxID=4058 RepID=A0ACC0AVU9_CATRO|nr:hypothetical protein M9H77_22924 [Catharanthus roseus]